MKFDTCRLVGAAALAVAALHGSLAYADAASSSSLHDFKITLTDLDLADGIAPSVSFSQWSSLDATIAYASVLGAPDVRNSGPAPFLPIEASQTSMGASGSGSLAGDGSLEGLTIGATASFFRSTNYIFGAVGIGSTWGAVLLSPQTQLTITAVYDLSAQTTQGTFSVGAYTVQEAARARVSLALIGPYDAALQNYSSRSVCDAMAGDMPYSIWTGTYPSALPFHETKTGTCQVTLTNNGLTDQRGSFSIQSDASIGSVPEPSSLALLAAGGGLLFAASRRRARGR